MSLAEPALGQGQAGEKTAPLGFSQQYLWFLNQYPDAGPARFNSNILVELFGALDVRALSEALAVIEARHEPLRTCLRIVKGQPTQIVLPPSGAPLEVLDLSHLSSEEERQRAVADVVHEEQVRPLDFARGPVQRVRLLRLDAGTHLLLWTTNHVNVDAWSHRNFVAELRVLYGALVAGVAPVLPALPTQYTDFARAQRMAPTPARRAAFWRAHLEGAGCYTPPHRQPRPARPSPELTRWVELPPTLSDGIDAAASALGCTRFSVLLAALGAVAERWSGATDVVVMVASAHRTLESEALIGSLADSMPVRLRFAPGDAHSNRVRAAQSAVLGALFHELPLRRIEELTGQTYRFTYAMSDHVPFEDLAEDPGQRILLRSDAFERSTGRLGADIRFRASMLPMRLYRMDLFFTIQRARLVCTYQPDLFMAETIDQVLEWFREALSETAAACT